jgi:hypothetical protein
MGALMPLAIVNDYAGLHAAFRQYIETIDVSREAIDDSAGWAGGYAGKVLAPSPSKMFGRQSLGDFLQGTGLVLIVAQDLQAFNKRRDFLPPRQTNQVRLGHECWNRKKAKPKPKSKATRRTRGKYE